jgi:hypothetical protein
MKKFNPSILFTFVSLLLIGCGGSSTPNEQTPNPTTYAVNVTVTGLDGTLVLQNNGANNLTITSSGDETFTTELEDGEDFDVSISDSPADQNCILDNESGTIDGADVEVEVSCITQKNMFRTAVDFDGDLGGIVGADALCMSDANYPGSGTYKALIVDGTLRVACTTANCLGGVSEHVDWVFDPLTPYELLDGTLIGTTNDVGIFDIPLENNLGNDGLFYTGLTLAPGFEWTESGDTCADWTDNTVGEEATLGSTFETDERAFWESVFGTVACNGTLYLMCVEQ